VNDFTCAVCHGTFPKAWTDEECEAERADNGWADEPCDLVCDLCYQVVVLGLPRPSIKYGEYRWGYFAS
jgi:hypothetical protein